MTFKSAIHRAAVLVKSLPQPQAAKLLACLDAAELQQVFREIRNLDQISEQEIQLARAKFVAKAKSADGKTSGFASLQNEAPLEFLNHVSSDIRFQLVSSEHPAIVATVVSKLTTPLALELIRRFEPVQRVSVLRRLCKREILDSKKLDSLSTRLQKRLNDMLNSDPDQQASLDVASRLLSCFDPLDRETCLEALESDDIDLAANVQSKIFQFEDVQLLPDREVRKILRWLDTSLWAPALVNSSQAIRRKIFNNMAERPRLILNREIESLAAVDAETSNLAQLKIIETVLELEANRKVSLKLSHPAQEPNRQAA